MAIAIHKCWPKLCLDLISLHLLQIQLTLADDMLMHNPTMLSGSPPLVLDCLLMKSEGCHDRFQRTAIRQQRDYHHHRFRIRPQQIEDRALPIRKCFLTLMTNVPLFYSTMHTNITFSKLSCCLTVNIGAKYLLWVHWFCSNGVVTTRVCQ
jgi:hypothetical protein